MRRIGWLAAVLVLAIVASACGDDGAGDDGAGEEPGVSAGEVVEIRAEVDREVPAATDTADVVAGDAAFALDLYRELLTDTPDANLFLSPYSISVALGMTLAGARTETYDQMATVLRAIDGDGWHADRNALDQELLRDRPTIEGLDPMRLEIANSLWGQAGYPFSDEFLEVLARHYGAGLRTVDFEGRPEPSRVAINDWVEDATEERVVDLIPEGAIDVLTRLVLVNAIYFKANWISPFDAGRTADGPFRTLDGTEVTAPLMRGQVTTGYAEGDGWQAARLRYAGEASMLVLAPEEGRFEEIAGSLDPNLLDEVRSALSESAVDLWMPRFEMTSQFSLLDALERLGMVDAFVPPRPDQGADFTGMADTRELYVTDVVHQAFVSVDEEGTEAAAATAVIMGRTSAPPPATLHLDRPFIVLVEDDATGAILFVGQVTNPAAG